MSRKFFRILASSCLNRDSAPHTDTERIRTQTMIHFIHFIAAVS